METKPITDDGAVDVYAARVLGMMTDDMERGLLPAVRTFADAHDHVDANMYVIWAGVDAEDTSTANAVMDLVDGRLRALNVRGLTVEMRARLRRLPAAQYSTHPSLAALQRRGLAEGRLTLTDEGATLAGWMPLNAQTHDDDGNPLPAPTRRLRQRAGDEWTWETKGVR